MLVPARPSFSRKPPPGVTPVGGLVGPIESEVLFVSPPKTLRGEANRHDRFWRTIRDPFCATFRASAVVLAARRYLGCHRGKTENERAGSPMLAIRSTR